MKGLIGLIMEQHVSWVDYKERVLLFGKVKHRFHWVRVSGAF